jgi:pyruvate dehydrogenase E2 component (dihydrolipoamide acetyltransferase)
MPTDIKMPQLSDTMSAGKILAWMKKEGEEVKRGDILAEVETDKANLQIESFNAGVLLKIQTQVGSSAKVGEVIGILGQAGETVSSAPVAAKAVTPTTTAAPTPNAAPPTPTMPVTATSPSSSERVKISPLAKKLAEEKNIEINGLVGSGPNGRVVRKDIESAAQTAPVVPSRTAAPAATTPPVIQHTRSTPAVPTGQNFDGSLTPFSKMRETIARRMQESVVTSPHFYVTATVMMDEAIKFRETLKERPDYKGISINHLVIKSAAYAMEREPRVNFTVREGQLYKPAGINIGIITAVDDGLLIPVIHQANTLSLKDLVFEARSAVDRARAGRPSAADLSGGTFSISNMGMFDVENFTAIINPGQGGILAVSSVKEEAIVDKGIIRIGKTMKVTISVDHRIIDGVMGGTWLKHFKQALEMPALMLA